MPKHRRKAVTEARVWLRRHSDPARALPDFVIIGAQRSGTSSLYKWLESHPHVVASLRKEPEYFTYRYPQGEAWYRAHFPSRRRRWLYRAAGRHLTTFEASPYSLFDPRAPARAHGLLPDAKLVVLLRNPIDRAFSHHRHMVAHGHEDLPFEAALDAEAGRLAGEEERMLADPTYVSWAHERYAYFSRGIYADQLERWRSFYPADHIRVVRSEDLFAEPLQQFATLLEFLGLAPFTPAFRNESRPDGQMADGPSGALRRRLAERYRPHNERLGLMLGVDMGWETTPMPTRAGVE